MYAFAEGPENRKCGKEEWKAEPGSCRNHWRKENMKIYLPTIFYRITE